MFNFQGSELIIILLLALVILGPEKLPEAMRRMGRFYADLRKMSTSFQDEFRAAVDEPVREIRNTANTLRDSADFRKLADGDREEKPKSAEMADATPRAEADGASEAPDAASDVDPETAPAVVRDTTPTPVPPPPAPFASSQPLSTRPDDADPAVESDAVPAPEAPRPEPFSSAQQFSARPRGPEPDPEPTPVDAAGWPAPAVPPVRQIAVEDESGLREARPLEPSPDEARQDIA